MKIFRLEKTEIFLNNYTKINVRKASSMWKFPGMYYKMYKWKRVNYCEINDFIIVMTEVLDVMHNRSNFNSRIIFFFLVRTIFFFFNVFPQIPFFIDSINRKCQFSFLQTILHAVLIYKWTKNWKILHCKMKRLKKMVKSEDDFRCLNESLILLAIFKIIFASYS